MWNYFLFLKDFIYLFLERGKEGKREGEKRMTCERCIHHIWEIHPRVASPMPPAGGLAHNPRMCPDWIKPVTFLNAGQCPINWATPIRAGIVSLIIFLDCSFLVYRKATNFCINILIQQQCLIQTFFVVSVEFSTYYIVSDIILLIKL